MGDKDARVRLNLSAAGFLTAMQQLQKQGEEFAKAVEGIGEASEKSSRKTSGFFAAVKAGAGGAARGVSELGQHLKSVLTTAATLGGSLSIAGGIREAQALQSSYKDLAFAISRGTGAAYSWQQVQGDIEVVSGKWKRSNREVQQSYADIFQETGNLEFSKRAIDAVGQAANVTGKSTELWAHIAGTLGEKFDIGASGIHDGMATIVDRVNQGGISAEELDTGLARVGASAQQLGYKGKAALEMVLGGLNMADQAIGPPRQKLIALGNLLEQLADPEKAKEIQKTLGVSLLDAKGEIKGGALDRILAKTRGKQSELAKVFSGGELKLVTTYGREFEKGFDAAKGSLQTKTAAGLEALHKALEVAGKGTMSAAELQEKANERNKDAQRNLQSAMNDFVKAFERPELVHAVDQLAAQAPRLAATLGRLVEFTAAHPAAAAAAVVGGYAAKGALTAVVTKISDEAMDRGGKLLGKGLEGSWSAGGKVAGAAFVVAAGAAGYEIGKQLADYFLNKDQARLDKTGDLASTAEAMVKHGTGTPEQRKQAAAALRAQIADMEKEGPSTYTETIGAYAAKFAGDPELDPRVQRARAIANAKAQLAALEGSKPAPTLPDVTNPPTPAPAAAPSAASRQIASEVARGDGKVTISNEQDMAAAIARATAAMTLNVRVIDGGGNGSNGLPPAPGNNSGSTPR